MIPNFTRRAFLTRTSIGLGIMMTLASDVIISGAQQTGDRHYSHEGIRVL